MKYIVSTKTFEGITVVDKTIGIDEALQVMDKMAKIIALDTEGTGRFFKLDKLITVQVYDEETFLLFDCETVDISLFKEQFERRRLVIHNAKHDLKFLFSHDIVPLQVYDTFLIEVILNMGDASASYSLSSLVNKYCKDVLDKSSKGSIIYKGIEDSTVQYCFDDVKHLLDIRRKQLEILVPQGQKMAGILENNMAVALAYIEWCGVKVDKNIFDEAVGECYNRSVEAKKNLDEFVFKYFKNNKKLCSINKQGDLFSGFSEEKVCFVKWNSEKSVDMVRNRLDENNKEEFELLYKAFCETDSVYRTYKGFSDNSIQEDTGRIYPEYMQIGSTGRLVPTSKVQSKYGYMISIPVVINMPKGFRKSIHADEGSILITSDWSAQELRLIASTTKDEALMKVVRDTEDPHAYIAMKFIPGKYLKGKSKEEIHELGKKLSFSLCYGSSTKSLAKSLGIDETVAKIVTKKYFTVFKGVMDYQESVKSFIISSGFIDMNTRYGYRTHVNNLDRLRNDRKMMTGKFWKDYAKIKATNPNSPIINEVKWFMAERNKLHNFAINSVFQNNGSIMLKTSIIRLFHHIVKEDMFGKVKITIPMHDSITIECPIGEQEKWKSILEECMTQDNPITNDVLFPVVTEIKEHF